MKTMSVNEFNVVILAGGESSRMKSEKGLVLFQGKPLIQHVIDAVRPVTDKIILIVHDKRYNEFNLPCFPDIFPGVGPMGGIYSGLTYSNTAKNFVLSCDIPFITSHFISSFVQLSGEEDVLVPVHEGKMQPLCSVYDQRCRVELQARIQTGKYKLQDCIAQMKLKRVHVDTKYPDAEKLFTNLNTPDELSKFENHQA